MKSYNILLISLSGILILLNFLLLAQFEPQVHRWGRVISTLCLLAVFLKGFNPKKTLLLLIFLLFLAADLIALNYHMISMQQGFFAFQSLAYILFLFRIGHYLIKPRLKLYQKIYFSLVLFFNSVFVIMIGDLLSAEVQNTVLQILFYVYGISAILFISGGILYYDRFPNYLSTAFLLAVAGLVLSNLMGFSAHFLGFSESFYIDRFLYVLGIAGLVAYSHYFDELRISVSEKKTATSGEENEKRSKAQQTIDAHVDEHNYL